MSTQNKLSKRVIAALAARRDEAQWEKLIVGLLHKLELPREKRLKAIEKYEKLGRHIARKLGVGEADVHMLAYSTPSRTPFRSDGGQHSALMADTVPR